MVASPSSITESIDAINRWIFSLVSTISMTIGKSCDKRKLPQPSRQNGLFAQSIRKEAYFHAGRSPR